MQYGIEILPYKRSKQKKSDEGGKNKKQRVLEAAKPYIFFGLLTFLFSRVRLINGMAPFGIAFILCMATGVSKEIFISVSVSGILGYLTLMNKIDFIGQYIICCSGLILLNNLLGKEKIKIRFISMTSYIFTEYVIMKILFFNYSVVSALIYSLMEIAIVLSVYYIINKGILCFKEMDNRRLYSNEELISMAVIMAIVITGTWGIKIMSVSLINVIALYFIAMAGYICGVAKGAAIGVTLGVIVGMTLGNMAVYISIFGTCGIIAGVFKDTNKYFMLLAYVTTFFIMQISMNGRSQLLGVELVLAVVALGFTSKKCIDKLNMDFNFEFKREEIKEDYSEKIRAVYHGRMKNLSGLLYNISETLDNLVDNEKLELKEKSSAIIENLADRVCSKCSMRSTCWKREMHYTYSAFSQLIQNYQENIKEIPFELENKCINRTILMKNTEEIVNKYILEEMKHNSLCEGREIIAAQMNNMAHTINDIGGEIGDKIYIDITLETKIRRLLDKNSIPYLDVMCIREGAHRNTVKIVVRAIAQKYCQKEILSLVSEANNSPMIINKEGCVIDSSKNTCTVVYEETPKYHIDTYVAVKCKEGENCSGDSYMFEKLRDGTHLNIISDGMGTGPQAKIESEAAVKLIHEFCQSGFSKNAAISTINSIMGIKFSEREKFATMDLCSVDLYTGEAQFMKVGAVDSFVKKKGKVKVIGCSSLPFGILDKADVQVEEVDCENGDLIVMVSDGVIDYNESDNLDSNWMEQYMKTTELNTPKEIAMDILEQSLSRNNDKVKDDMTILVSKVYAVY
ncbi:stage II sporulation protein E [Hathewaya proteolytica DSM 3090]|uniref:Stage II sporulation protein E n=1 Tax=Hathewaya proteolytica DSM 3090 TaxID=1121331 RepID=A0A1M6M9K8_9CLOT|nr:stage II sporulation protein E [Hathewaya proteolytica]SHJ79973.1 stage II sporulation protein E [Hathewaya proteolytica DSM 3090]